MAGLLSPKMKAELKCFVSFAIHVRAKFASCRQLQIFFNPDGSLRADRLKIHSEAATSVPSIPPDSSSHGPGNQTAAMIEQLIKQVK